MKFGEPMRATYDVPELHSTHQRARNLCLSCTDVANAQPFPSILLVALRKVKLHMHLVPNVPKCMFHIVPVCSHYINIMSISINCLFEGPTSWWGRWCLGKLDFIDLVVKGHSQWVVEFLLAGLLSFTCAPAVTVSKTALWIWSKYIQIHLIWTRCSTSVR